MENYLLFVLIASITVLSPGPGVILTLTNAISYGMRGAIGGIFGIAFGTFMVAGISATSLGVILATSSIAFSILKYIGAAYLIYLGIRLWNAPVTPIEEKMQSKKGKKLQFLEGLTLQLTNPKAVFFFMSIFPQFVDFSKDHGSQFAFFVITYSSLVVIIHVIYAYLAKKSRKWLSSQKGGKRVNRLGGGTFIFFGIGLASASK